MNCGTIFLIIRLHSTQIQHSLRILLCLRHVDRLPLRVVEPVHGVDAGQHPESPQADQGEAQSDDQADPGPDAHQLAAEPLGAEARGADVKHLETRGN